VNASASASELYRQVRAAAAYLEDPRGVHAAFEGRRALADPGLRGHVLQATPALSLAGEQRICPLENLRPFRREVDDFGHFKLSLGAVAACAAPSSCETRPSFFRGPSRRKRETMPPPSSPGAAAAARYFVAPLCPG